MLRVFVVVVPHTKAHILDPTVPSTVSLFLISHFWTACSVADQMYPSTFRLYLLPGSTDPGTLLQRLEDVVD